MVKQLLLVAALGGIASVSLAAEPVAAPFSAPGAVYAGADVGASVIPLYSNRRTRTSYGGFVGYTLTPNFAVEASFRKLYQWNGPVDEHEDAKQTALSLLGSIPVATGLSLYGRVGVNQLSRRSVWTGSLGPVLKHEYTDRTVHGLFGLGASYQLTEKVATRVEVQLPAKLEGHDRRLTNYSAGISYAF